MENTEKKETVTQAETTADQPVVIATSENKTKSDTADKSPKTDKNKPPKAAKVADAVEAIGKKILSSYPKESIVYMTADGQGFFNESDALNHADDLTNKKVTPVRK